jgi:Phage portal protein
VASSFYNNIKKALSVLTGTSKAIPNSVVIKSAVIDGVHYKHANSFSNNYNNLNTLPFFHANGNISVFNKKNYYTNNFTEALDECPPIAIILSKKCIAFTNGILNVKDKNGNDCLEKYKYKKILAQPNPKQSDKQFRMEILFQTQLSRFCVVKLVRGFTGEILQMYPLPSSNICITPKKNAGLIIQKYSDLFESITYEDGNTRQTLDLESIYIFTDITAYANNLTLPISRLDPIAISIDNIIKNLQARNGVLSDRMPLGVFTNDARDSMGSAQLIPSTKSQKDAQDEEFANDYGLDRLSKKVVISENAFKWQQIEIDYNKLMMEEQFVSDYKIIADAFGVPFNLVAHGSNSTYANMSEAEKALYQNAIITESDSYSQQLMDCLNADKDKVIIHYSFDHLSCLQPNKKLEAETFEKNVKASVELFVKNGCTYKSFLGLNHQDNSKALDLFFWQMPQEFQDSFLKNNQQNNNQNGQSA